MVARRSLGSGWGLAAFVVGIGIFALWPSMSARRSWQSQKLDRESGRLPCLQDAKPSSRHLAGPGSDKTQSPGVLGLNPTVYNIVWILNYMDTE